MLGRVHLQPWIKLAIIFFGWMTYAQVIRGNIMALRDQEYALAARALGVGGLRMLWRHLLPNAIFPVLVIASMHIGSYVLNFAALSFRAWALSAATPTGDR